eukprot:1156954-Prorocentrum_minimum.AAC.1
MRAPSDPSSENKKSGFLFLNRSEHFADPSLINPPPAPEARNRLTQSSARVCIARTILFTAASVSDRVVCGRRRVRRRVAAVRPPPPAAAPANQRGRAGPPPPGADLRARDRRREARQRGGRAPRGRGAGPAGAPAAHVAAATGACRNPTQAVIIEA